MQSDEDKVIRQKMVERVEALKEGESTFISWKRWLTNSRDVYAILSSYIPERTFDVHETINGYTIKSI